MADLIEVRSPLEVLVPTFVVEAYLIDGWDRRNKPFSIRSTIWRAKGDIYFYDDGDLLFFTNKDDIDPLINHGGWNRVGINGHPPSMAKLSGYVSIRSGDEHEEAKFVWITEHVQYPLYVDNADNGIRLYFTDEHEFALYSLNFPETTEEEEEEDYSF